MLSTTNLEEEEIVDAPGIDGNASMPEQVKRLNPWRKMMMMMMIYHFQLDNVRSDVCVWMRVCVCVCVCYQCVSVGKQDHSVLQLPSDET